MMIYKHRRVDRRRLRRLLDVNFLGAAFFTTQALRHMAGGGAWGSRLDPLYARRPLLVASLAAAKVPLEMLDAIDRDEGRVRNIQLQRRVARAVATAMLRSSPLHSSAR